MKRLVDFDGVPCEVDFHIVNGALISSDDRLSIDLTGSKKALLACIDTMVNRGMVYKLGAWYVK